MAGTKPCEIVDCAGVWIGTCLRGFSDDYLGYYLVERLCRTTFIGMALPFLCPTGLTTEDISLLARNFVVV